MASKTRASKLGPLQIGIIVLTVATALIHLGLNFPDPAFILNGLGYLALVAALYVPLPRKGLLAVLPSPAVLRWLLIGFTALTVVLWLIFGARTTIGYVDKLIELALIGLLLLDRRQTSDK